MNIGLLGRTNVGKSTLFNKLIGTHRAIVTDISGTTRELLREPTEFMGIDTVMIDSPGLERFEQERDFLKQIIEESDILIFMVDGKLEASEYDVEIKNMIVAAGKKNRTILAVNKLDGKVFTEEVYMLLAEWYERGFEFVIPLSAQQSEGIELVREGIRDLVKNLGIEKTADTDVRHKGKSIPVAIVGRPNVGKSTLINSFAGERVAHVSEKAGTTLDYITQVIDYRGEEYTVYDTAGIRKKGRTIGIERIAYSKTQTMLEYKQPVVIMMMDLEEGFTKRDLSLIGEIYNMGLPLMIACNKIDLMEPEVRERTIKQIRRKHEFLKNIPMIPISGKESIGVGALLDMSKKIYKDRGYRISTSTLNNVLSRAWALNPPRFPKNKICKWKYVTQVSTQPPKFVLSVNNKEYANFSFKRWVENIIRTEHRFLGIPIKINFTSKVETNPYLDK